MGRAVQAGMRQSIPSVSIETWAWVSVTVPLPVCGHTNRALGSSSRFAYRHRPWPSQCRALIRSPRRPLKMNSAPPYGLSDNAVYTSGIPSTAAGVGRLLELFSNSTARGRVRLPQDTARTPAEPVLVQDGKLPKLR